MTLRRRLTSLRLIAHRLSAGLKARAKGARLAPGKLRITGERGELSQTLLLEKAEELGPIFKVWLPHKFTTCIVGHEIARRFLSENEGKIKAGTPDLRPLFPYGFLRALEGPVHRTYRRQILDAFNATPLEPHEDALRGVIRDGLRHLAGAGNPVPNDLIRKTMKDMTTAVFFRLIFGLETGSKRYADFVAAYARYAPDGPFRVVLPQHKPAYADIKALVLDLAGDIGAGKDMPPSLLRHLIQSNTVDDTTLGNLIQMAEASRYDVHGLWTWIFKHLGDNPAAVRLAWEGQKSAQGTCPAVQAIPMETLRMEQSELLLRVATEDIVFDGYFIPRKSHIRICVWEAHHDPAKFDCPFEYRPERFMSGKIPSSLYSPFGLDKHRCLGADWTFRVSELLVEELTAGYELSVTDDGTPVSGKFHFEPSRSFSVDIQRRG